MRYILALFLMGCAASVSSPRVIVLPPWALGRTDCVDGVPISVIRGEMAPADSAEVDAHEARHRRQMTGNCHAFLQRFRDSVQFAVKHELDAYCAGIATRPVNERQMRRDNLLIYVRTRSGLDEGAIQKMYEEVCS